MGLMATGLAAVMVAVVAAAMVLATMAVRELTAAVMASSMLGCWRLLLETRRPQPWHTLAARPATPWS